MIVETNELVTIKHYADMWGVTTTSVYSWISKSSVDCVEIDGVKFIRIKANEKRGKEVY